MVVVVTVKSINLTTIYYGIILTFVCDDHYHNYYKGGIKIKSRPLEIWLFFEHYCSATHVYINRAGAITIYYDKRDRHNHNYNIEEEDLVMCTWLEY